MNLYRIWFSDGNDRDEIGRVSANDIDQAIEYALKQYFEPDLEYTEDGDPDYSIYLMIDSCKYCNKEEIAEINDIDLEDIEEICENCETSEYIEIQLDNNEEPEYKTIFGTNEYANLETDQRPTTYNETLAKAWNKPDNSGILELMYQTINNNPKIINGIDFEYLKKINKNHKELTEESNT